MTRSSAASASSASGSGVVSPVRVFVLVLAVVFTVECVIMLVLWSAEGSSGWNLLMSLVDAVVLIAVLCPALWLLIVRPLRALVTERGELFARTLKIQEDERARLARDLHDEIGQTQTAILLGLRSVSDSRSLEQARERAESVHEMAVEAIDSTRRIARGLSPGVLVDFGLQGAVERVCEDVSAASGIAITRDLRMNGARLAHHVEIGVYRVLQEAITNAVKHSGASEIRVELALHSGALDLCVADNGRGMEPAPASRGATGLGLAGMRERVVLLGGEFRVGSSPGAGTTLHATVPVTEKRA